MIRIDPPIPLKSPKGDCWAHFLIDMGPETDLQWVVFQDDSGECWTWQNREIRAQNNITLGRIIRYDNDTTKDQEIAGVTQTTDRLYPKSSTRIHS